MRLRCLLLSGAASAGLLWSGIASASATIAYTYDALGRLVTVIDDNGPAAKAVSLYAYDAAGNRQSVVVAKTDSLKFPVFTFYDGRQHFYTASYPEGRDAGLNFQRVQFNLLASGQGALPLYRCLVSGTGDHFISAFSNCEGTIVEGLLGYAAAAPASGLVPLYRFYKASASDHFVTTDYADAVANGYSYEGILGYVPPNP